MPAGRKAGSPGRKPRPWKPPRRRRGNDPSNNAALKAGAHASRVRCSASRRTPSTHQYSYPVGGLHGKLTVTAKLAPGRAAFPCGVRRHDAGLELGDMSPGGSHHPATSRHRLACGVGSAPIPPSIKAKTPAIVPHQGISRHSLKNESSPHRRAIPTRHALSPPSLDVGRGGRPQGLLDVGCFGQIPICVYPRPSAVKSPLFAYFAYFAVQPPPPPIKAKTLAIVPYQGSSRQTMKCLNGGVGRVTPRPPSGRTQTPALAGGGGFTLATRHLPWRFGKFWQS